MSDDIVNRLYKLCLCCRCGCGQSCSDCEAADEIERLRKEANVWRGICERFAESDPRFDAFRIYFKAVRGE